MIQSLIPSIQARHKSVQRCPLPNCCVQESQAHEGVFGHPLTVPLPTDSQHLPRYHKSAASMHPRCIGSIDRGIASWCPRRLYNMPHKIAPMLPGHCLATICRGRYPKPGVNYVG